MANLDWGMTHEQARERLLTLTRERAFRDGLDITLASGKKSTFYIDGKKITLDPEGMFLFARLLLDELASFPDVTAVGGMSIGADPIATAVSVLSHTTERPIPAFLVRKEAKTHGTGGQIVGALQPGQKVAIVEDTITTGGSSLRAIRAVQEAGAVPVVVFALVDREDPDGEAFRREFRVRPVFSLSDLRGESR